jgi:hypothetical protein
MAQNNDGSGWATPSMQSCGENYVNGTSIRHIGNKNILVQCPTDRAAIMVNSAGTGISVTSGYVRVMCWK